MDDDAIGAASVMKEAKAKDKYFQLAEKVEQVRSQMATMERKYDELYKTIKEKDSKTSSPSVDPQSPDIVKTPRESIKEPAFQISDSRTKIQTDAAQSTEIKEEKSASKKSSAIDIEKLEDNPFM